MPQMCLVNTIDRLQAINVLNPSVVAHMVAPNTAPTEDSSVPITLRE